MALIATFQHNIDITNSFFQARHSEDFWKATAANIAIIIFPVIFLVAASEMTLKNGGIFALNCGIAVINAGHDLYRKIKTFNSPWQFGTARDWIVSFFGKGKDDRPWY